MQRRDNMAISSICENAQHVKIGSHMLTNKVVAQARLQPVPA
jgi:hypothetical protein